MSLTHEWNLKGSIKGVEPGWRGKVCKTVIVDGANRAKSDASICYFSL